MYIMVRGAPRNCYFEALLSNFIDDAYVVLEFEPRSDQLFFFCFSFANNYKKLVEIMIVPI